METEKSYYSYYKEELDKIKEKLPTMSDEDFISWITKICENFKDDYYCIDLSLEDEKTISDIIERYAINVNIPCCF